MVLVLLLFALIGMGGVYARDKIVGGIETDIMYFPYQVALERSDVYKYTQICGGAILNSRFIVSAAHCVFDLPYEFEYRFRAGTSIREDGGELLEIARLWYHPLYSKEMKDYDVSVFRLTADIQFSTKIQPIAMVPEGRAPKLGERLLVSGWGLEEYEDYDSPDKLRWTMVYGTVKKLCQMKYSEVITSRMICSASPGRDSCSGDSGGPLINQRNELVGIVSFGLNCALPGAPGVYTSIANKEIQDYINEKISAA